LDDVGKRWLTVEPSHGLIFINDSVEIKLTVFVDEISAREVFVQPDYLDGTLEL
jgi:hypothetical protein